MKVLGIIDGGYGKPSYICEVNHAELQKYLDRYYNREKEELRALKVNDEVDLAKGHDFYQDTKAALTKTQEFIESHQRVIDTIFTGIKIMANGGGEVS